MTNLHISPLSAKYAKKCYLVLLSSKINRTQTCRERSVILRFFFFTILIYKYNFIVTKYTSNTLSEYKRYKDDFFMVGGGLNLSFQTRTQEILTEIGTTGNLSRFRCLVDIYLLKFPVELN